MDECNKSKNYLVGIAGGSGSGKTSFIKKLQESFSETEVCVISQDNYYKKIEAQYIDKNGVVNFDLPSSLNLKEFYSDIQKLKKGETLRKEEYSFNNELAEAKTYQLKPAPIIIAEGLFVFAKGFLRKEYDLKVLVDATDDKKIIRRIKRDRIERNYPLEDVLYRYEHHVIPSYLKYIEPHKKDVDIIINNNDSFDVALDILVSFLKVKLSTLK